MATTTEPISTATLIPTTMTVGGDQCVVLREIGWSGYRTMLRLRGERSVPRMTYLDGDVPLMRTSHMHEWLNGRLGMFVEIVVMELNIPRGSTKQTTNFKEEIDLRVDLVIEVVHTHSAKHALEVLRRLGVPEVWVCKRVGLGIMALTAEGQYVEFKSSLCLPFLMATKIFNWVTRPNMASRTEWSLEVQRWARETMIPRRRAMQG